MHFVTHSFLSLRKLAIMCHCSGVEGACLVPWVVGPPDASFGFYPREAFQSQYTVAV